MMPFKRSWNTVRIFLTFLLLVGAAGCAGHLSRGVPPEPIPLTILFFNDPHGHLMPFEIKSGDKKEEVGGIARMAAVVRDIRAENSRKNGRTLLLVAGDLLLVASPGRWFAYPWWRDAREAPDYAGHVDIHNKPGYDPCELFFGRSPFRTCQDPARVRGTHGLTGPDCETAFVSTQPFACSTLPAFAAALRTWLAPA